MLGLGHSAGVPSLWQDGDKSMDVEPDCLGAAPGSDWSLTHLYPVPPSIKRGHYSSLSQWVFWKIKGGNCAMSLVHAGQRLKACQLFIFICRGGAEREGESESQTDSTPSSEPDMELDLTI